MSFTELSSVNGFQPAPDGMHRPGADRSLIVLFSREAVLNETKSAAEGRPIYDAVDFVRVQQPGERDYQKRPIRPDDPHRWPHQWQAYKAAQEQAPDGTPLDVLFPTQPEIVAMLRGLQVLTVEHLSELGEHAISRIGPGARMWKEQALKLLEQARTAAPLHAAERLIKERDEKITQLETQIAAIMSRLGDDDDDRPRRRRRVEQEQQ